MTPILRWRLGAVTIAAALASAGAMAQSDNATGPTTGAMVGGKAATSLSHADVSFMKDAAEAGHAEVEASQMALSKASSDKVKAFAQEMITDHTKAGDELAALATAKHVDLPSGPSMTQKAKAKLLSARSGAGFDRSYASQIGVSAHEDAVKLFQKASTSAKDPDVKAFAQKTLPTLQHHLEMAREMKAATEPVASKAGGDPKM